MILKFDLKKLGKLAAISAASLALIVPLSMNNGTVANAAEGPYYYDDGELVYNGFTNEDGYWIGSKRDKWLYDNGLLDPDGDYSDEYDTVKEYSKARHMSLVRAMKIYNVMESLPARDFDGTFHGRPIYTDNDSMDVTNAIMHHKYPNRANNHHAIKRRGKRTSRKPHKKNTKRGHKGRKPRTRKNKRVARKGIKRNRNHKRTVKARKPKKRRRTAKRQSKPKKPATKQGKRKWITYYLPSKQKGSKQGEQQPRKWITYHFK